MPVLPATAFAARTPLDQLRSLDCLAQAIYYEAGSESEEGQRAVAQVVLNRVRHPAWPNSVCGVVYQGPMRPGGGCQFTFTCDGSLARVATGPGWDRARRLAAAALAGATFAPVGLATHYHNDTVYPSWAPRLVSLAIIGRHHFYALGGAWGASSAFAARYSGVEPIPHPVVLFPRSPLTGPSPVLAFDPVATTVPGEVARGAATPTLPVALIDGSAWLPQSTVRPEFRNSGRWRSDVPASVSGITAGIDSGGPVASDTAR